MPRTLAAVTCLLFLLACAPHAALNPVQPIQFDGRTYCTVWSINEQEGYWATAGHCAVAAMWYTKMSEGGQSTIDGTQASIIYVDSFTDTAVFRADAHAVSFHLAPKALDIGEALAVIGYFLGLERTETHGSMAVRNTWLFHPTYDSYVLSDLLDITTGPGNSGSPVLNKRGEVVGLLWGGFEGFGISASIPLDSLRTSLGRFFRPR